MLRSQALLSCASSNKSIAWCMIDKNTSLEYLQLLGSLSVGGTRFKGMLCGSCWPKNPLLHRNSDTHY